MSKSDGYLSNFNGAAAACGQTTCNEAQERTVHESANDENFGAPECAVCLQQCIHPVKLPCSHTFCYLCIKGVAGHNRRCALCRAVIPEDFIRRPTLVSVESLSSARNQDTSSEDGSKYRWYYEGNGGWWEYDERTSIELEKYHQERQSNEDNKSTTFEILIAGFIYVIDLENGYQYRRGYPRRRRRIKRDLAGIHDCKGIAGLKCVKPKAERREGDGGEINTVTGVPSSATAPHPPTVVSQSNGSSSIRDRQQLSSLSTVAAAAASSPTSVTPVTSSTATGMASNAVVSAQKSSASSTVSSGHSSTTSHARPNSDNRFVDSSALETQMAALNFDGLRQRRHHDSLPSNRDGGSVPENHSQSGTEINLETNRDS